MDKCEREEAARLCDAAEAVARVLRAQGRSVTAEMMASMVELGRKLLRELEEKS